jgi:hypothetical protein
MPWLATDPMNERVKFMAACLAREDDDESFAELCERYGISAKTGYKWLRRYEQGDGGPSFSVVTSSASFLVQAREGALADSVGTTPEGVAVGDFTHSGHRDLTLAAFDTGPYVVRGKGDGTFMTPTNLDPAGTLVGGANAIEVGYGGNDCDEPLAVGDFDGDTVPDVVCSEGVMDSSRPQ